MKKVRIALIGAGRWGKNILTTLESFPECEIAYVETRDYRTLIDKTDIDGVVVATPGSTHVEVALPFIKRGLPVFIEKPFTTSLADAKRLQEAAEESGSLIFVGHLHLYNPAFIKTKELLGSIGTVRLLVGEGANNGPYREDCSAMWDWAPHDISMMLDIMGEMPTSVAAWGVATLRPGTNLYDTSQIKLIFPNGVVGLIFSSWLMPQKRKRLTVVGEKSSVVYDDVLPEKKVTLFEENGAKVSSPAYGPGMPLTLELQAFIHVITEKEKPQSGVAEGLQVVRVLDAAERSIAAGGVAITL